MKNQAGKFASERMTDFTCNNLKRHKNWLIIVDMITAQVSMIYPAMIFCCCAQRDNLRVLLSGRAEPNPRKGK